MNKDNAESLAYIGNNIDFVPDDFNINNRPFNLKEALGNKPVVTRCGCSVSQFKVFDTNYGEIVYAIVDNYPTDGEQCITSFRPIDGKFGFDCTKDHPFDLFMRYVGSVKWTSLYWDNLVNDVIHGQICDSKYKAECNKRDDENGRYKYLTTISFEE